MFNKKDDKQLNLLSPDSTNSNQSQSSQGHKNTKSNAFGFISNKQNPTNLVTPNIVSENNKNNAHANDPVIPQEKSNAFNFIKSKPQSQNQLSQQAEFQKTQSQPHQTQFQPQSKSQNQGDLLNMNFSPPDNRNTTGVYENAGTGYPTDPGLMGVNFGSPIYYPSSNFNIPPQGYNIPPQGYNIPPQGYNIPPQGYNIPPQGYNIPPQGYNIHQQGGYSGGAYHQSYPVGNIYPSSYVQPNTGYRKNSSNSQNGNVQQNLNSPKKDYDQLAEIQSGVINIAISEEQKKQELAKRQKKDDQDKYFDFIKF